jgi:ATP/maltotriose-dependent transcriptional regulator MalT
VIWLRLERDDNELGCFLRSLTAATNLALGEAAHDEPLDRNAIPSVSVQGIAADFIDRLSLSDVAVVLFLDDLETVLGGAGA